MHQITPRLMNWASILEEKTQEQALRTSQMPFVFPHGPARVWHPTFNLSLRSHIPQFPSRLAGSLPPTLLGLPVTGRLQLKHLRVPSSEAGQVLVIAFLCDPSILQHHNPVRHAHARKRALRPRRRAGGPTR